MPTYEYRCNNCKHELEIFQSIKDNPKKKCPECGKNALERLISGGGAILFKGSGFYETDYRSKDYKDKAEADKKASEAKPDTKADSKTEAKPDKKTDTKKETKPVAKKDKPAASKK